MKEQIRIAAVSILILTLVLGIAYPLLVCGSGYLLFPHHAAGGLIKNNENRIVGSKFIGQNFSAPYYFHPRPSYAGDLGYDAMASGASNLGPTSKDLFEKLQERIDRYRNENNVPASQKLPADAVTASGSGLDPHISLQNAYLQSPRIAAARACSVEQVKDEVRKIASQRMLGLFGEPHVNVLMLNIWLDQQFPMKS